MKETMNQATVVMANVDVQTSPTGFAWKKSETEYGIVLGHLS